jgi:NAD(P)H-dependent flavin oxidoreductase YrpB (nitropropane dioxygenase family)
MLTRVALVEGRLDAGILPTGQVAGLIEQLPTVQELIDAIVSEAMATLAALAARVGGPVPREEAVSPDAR